MTNAAPTAPTAPTGRQAEHPIEPLLLRRWSPRAMSGAPLPRAELLRLCEASRWAPSAGNLQPWRLVVVERDTPLFGALHGLLAGGNQPWAARAAALILFCGETHRTASDGTKTPARLHALDVGAAWMALALQGTAMGLCVHAMEGYDHEAARALLKLPDGVDPLVLVAVGLPGDKAQLPEGLQARESPNSRRPVAESVVFGAFGALGGAS